MNNFIPWLVRKLFYIAGLIVALFLVFYIATYGKYTVANTVEQDPSIPHITTANAVFHAETFGKDSSEVVVVLHGGPGNDYRYLLPLKELADEYYVVFYDQRGTGLSPRVNANELTMENMVNDLHSIIDYYAQGKQVNLIGHSWGAMLASGYIGRYPGRVNKVVLAEPGILTSEKAAEFMELAKMDLNFPFLWHMGKCWFQSLHVKGPDKQAGADYFFTAIFFNADVSLFKQHPLSNYYCDQELNNASIEYWRYSSISNKSIFQGAIDEDGRMHINLVRGVENYKNKVLFMTGECNTVIGEKYQISHMKYFPEAEMVVIKDAGHTMIGEKPEESLLVIRNYLSE